ncbi:MAG: hypothetical protein A2W23_05295 [Planctomycetes bacterium RBG_16_43_13]|nr:MAG: hypothetical protein A2W23_05295 [Planctomycetes bacterium RBG_16_43_13]
MAFITDTLPEKYHNAIVAWQKRHFTDYDYLIENWSRFYRQETFRLIAKVGNLKNELIEVGKNAGRQKFQKAIDMDDEMLEKAANIIRAQASTELGSIQQHRESLHKAQDAKIQFDVLRVMAEELRHAYQMIYILSNDNWGSAKNIAEETIQELLTMETGSHVLDAFNLYFDSFVDNIVFCALIDRVGKYQLTMQSVFAYAPMARSMAPMLSEEAFHLASGVNPIRQWASQATQGKGNVSIDNIQRHINKWLSRGLEMFGDERGGKSNVELGFKDMVNSEASDKYYKEVKELVIDTANYEIIKVKVTGITQPEAMKLADEVVKTGNAKKGVRQDDLLYLPSNAFYRRRGQYAFAMNDVQGNIINSVDEYISYLKNVLPEPYITGKDFDAYTQNLARHRRGEAVKETNLPFYG